jgi:hypothetical protein
MPRSLLREEQFKDIDVLSEAEHDSEVSHYFRKLADVTTYSGHANEFVVVNASGTGLEFSSSSAGLVEELYYDSNLVMSTASSGVQLNNAFDAFYFGAPNTSGTWRINRIGDDLVFERNEGTWIEKFKITSKVVDLLEL